MNGLVTGEWRKVTLRLLPYGMLALGVAYLALTLVLVPVLTSVLPSEAMGGQDMNAFLENVRSPGGYPFAAQQAVGQAAVFIVVFVAIVVAGEYTWGTLTLTFSIEPRRYRVLLAKLLVLSGLAVMGVGVSFALGLMMVSAVQPLLPADATSTMSGSWLGPTLRAFLAGLPSVVVWVCVATALAILTRNAGAAAGIGVALSIGEGFLQLVPFLRPALISSNTLALQATPGVDPTGGFFGASGDIPSWRAWMVLGIWAAVTVSLALWLLHRRDIT